MDVEIDSSLSIFFVCPYLLICVMTKIRYETLRVFLKAAIQGSH